MVIGILLSGCWWCWALSSTSTTNTGSTVRTATSTSGGCMALPFTLNFHQRRARGYPSILYTTTSLTTSRNSVDENDSDSSNSSPLGSSDCGDGGGTISEIAKIDPSTSCPFRSRYYPRIVPIPNRKRRKEEIRSDYIYQKQFWIPGQRIYIRNRFIQQQQQSRQSTSACNVEWFDSHTSDASKYNAILTLASLWNIVGNVTTSMSLPQQHLEHHNNHMDPKNSTMTTTTVIALPDADGYIVEQFANMVQWLFERQQIQQQQRLPTLSVSYTNTKVDFTTIPTIVLTLLTVSSPPPYLRTTQSSTTTMYYHHDIVSQRTKSWVQRILVDTAICPFTKSITYSGQGLSDVNVPVGKIAYHTSHSSFVRHDDDDDRNDAESLFAITAAICQLQSDVLVAIHDMLQAGPTYSMKQKLNGISSILLAAPGWDDHLDLWTRLVFPIFEVTVQVLGLTEQIGIVCFHPYYQTPDGRSFPGFGHMHSVPRLQQWLLDHRPYEEVDMAIENSVTDLMASNVISSPPLKMIEEDRSNNNNNESSNNQNYNVAIAAIATAGGAWQRRTPHATINVLRADQLAAAESKRFTPTLYSTNILRLSRMGWSQLQTALDHERNMQ